MKNSLSLIKYYVILIRYQKKMILEAKQIGKFSRELVRDKEFNEI